MRLKWFVVPAMVAMGSAAYAQSSVTLYGNVDAGVLYQSTAAATFSPVATNQGKLYRFKDGGIYASNWGIKGTEDIGGGYHVNFKLQGSFDTGTGKFGLADTTGGTAIFNQVATIGVSGPFGSVNAGRQIVPMAWAMAETDVRSAQYFGSILTAWLGMNQAAGWAGTNTNAPIGALYDSNAIVYESPKFGGVSAVVEYAPGGSPGHFQGGTRESAILKYSNYGLAVSAVYYNAHDTNPATGSPLIGVANNRFVYLGAKYTMQNGLSASASYSNGKNPSNANAVNIDMYSAGLGYQITPVLQVTSGLYYLKDKNNSANRSTEVAAGAEYRFSKTTMIYGQVGHVNNKGTMTTTITYGQPVAPGTGTTAVMLGMRHSF
ncbi:porin [Pandoraea terrae]|uniref:Porin n=1 Tax=Pandoraea terrae TaxID=1537710 RepID=A0A5E4WGB8_9BURK|nr:porin [Pandoraea terrae]VVE23193.1 porin [Pandoraea terrae]